MTMWIYIWLGVVAFSVMIEFLTMEQVSVWFIGGGIVAMILAAVNVDPVIQIVVFIVVSLVLLLSFRRMVMRFLMKNDNAKTNADALVGREYQLLSRWNLKNPLPLKSTASSGRRFPKMKKILSPRARSSAWSPWRGIS